MKKYFALAASALAGAALTTAAIAADTVRIGAMPVGSGWYVAASTLEKTLRPVIAGHTIEVIPRGGGVSNPVVVDTGKAEIALSNVQTSRLAAMGFWQMTGRRCSQAMRTNRAWLSTSVTMSMKSSFSLRSSVSGSS